MNALELIRMSNPYTEGLGGYVEASEWPSRLAINPLEGANLSAIRAIEREMLLNFIDLVFEPIRVAIQIAATLQEMIWTKYVLANPLLASSKLRRNQLLALEGQSNLELPWFPQYADALIIKSCTGFGKSTSLKRYLQLLPQVVKHAANPSAGWSAHVQIVYLVVPMPAFRGALLFAILEALDRALGTDYSNEFTKARWGIERLAVSVGLLLVKHAVGVLVLEEVQARNFAQAPNKEDMLLFLLRLLNFGIPIVMVGNPLGFVGVEEHSQDLGRLTAREIIELMPPSIRDDDWRYGIGPGLWSYNVMPISTPWSSAIGREVFNCSGAILRHVARAVVGSQRIALNEQASSVEPRHLRAYRRQSPSFLANQDLILGFKNRDPFQLMKFVDVPWEEYGLRWGKLDHRTILDIHPDDVGAKSLVDDISKDQRNAYLSVHANIRAQTAATLKRESKKASARAKNKVNPVTKHLAASLVQLAARVEASRQGKP